MKVSTPKLGLGLFVFIFLVAIVILIAVFEIIFADRIYPGVTVGYLDVSGQTVNQATSKLRQAFSTRTQTINLSTDQTNFIIEPQRLNFSYDASASAQLAFRQGRGKNWLENLRIKTLWCCAKKQNINSQVDISQDHLQTIIDKLAEKIDLPVQETVITIKDNQLQVVPGKLGRKVNKAQTSQVILDYLSIRNNQLPTIITDLVIPKVGPEQAQQALPDLEKLINSPLILATGEMRRQYNKEDLLSLYAFSNQGPLISWQVGSSSMVINRLLTYDLGDRQPISLLPDQEKVHQLTDTLAKQIDRPAQNAIFIFEAGKVTTFKPSQEGRKLDKDQTKKLITEALVGADVSRNIQLPVQISPAQVTTESVNTLGIKTLLARGVSHFAGSSANRIYNVRLTTNRINGTLVAPGETFSFNDVVGEVSATSGFKPAYVIRSGRTVLDDGGGVCQVSTTLFRAVLYAGLPVVSRTAHAYRVGYYEQGGFAPGLDATVYAPSVDFEFKNDTPSYILIQAYIAGATLYVDLYGTNDARIAKLSTPLVTNQTPPPADMRQEDPTLAKGQVRQVDFPAWGANVTFTRTVIKDGKIISSNKFSSFYRPWQAVYLVGTGQ
ncbi:VanW family protein [Candidatus Daviesbacteria bacterium]|nr:VanW family protein [Candidatus Daviesbacteria bacterium]